ncbi:hypothetical protein GGR57DRAFT_503671 [Xylariaceae sp. FL1272]|nr:hypothetical protein GGR57DRAFT_503671 [Xylariaceae sp. FL1272]
MPPTRWNDANERQLIAAVMHHGRLVAPSPEFPFGRVRGWTAIHQALRAQGLHCSKDAIQSQWVQIRRQLERNLAVANIPADATPLQTLSIISGVAIDPHAPAHNDDPVQDAAVVLLAIGNGDVGSLSFDTNEMTNLERASVGQMQNELVEMNDNGFELSVWDLGMHAAAMSRALVERRRQG